MDASHQSSGSQIPLGDQIESAIASLPPGEISLGRMLLHFGQNGLLVLTVLLTLVFLIPVSIPGVSTVFGAAILMVGLSRLSGKPLWLPARVRDRPLPSERIRGALRGGMRWVRRLERVSRPHRLPGLVEGRVVEKINDLAFILAALLLMAPFGLIPFSNTLPALALLCFSLGLMQRDGVGTLLGHLTNLVTIVYFSFLIGGGGMVIKEILQRYWPAG
ncbi:MAG: exopolysaccharide biosynthesis protein [Opitutaceae bacterium]|nr:exopolysaccharide biosynthesis protein [Opitutaceae bacterium]